MLSLWFWLQHWFTDVPGFWRMLGRIVVTAIGSIVALFLAGMALGWDGDTFATLATASMGGIWIWVGWIMHRHGPRRRTKNSSQNSRSPDAPSEAATAQREFCERL